MPPPRGTPRISACPLYCQKRAFLSLIVWVNIRSNLCSTELEPGHRVSDYVRVGSGLGSKLFTYRPGIVTRFLTEQQNDTADVSMLGTQWTHCAKSGLSEHRYPSVTVKAGANCLTVGPLPCRCISLSGRAVYGAAVLKRYIQRLCATFSVLHADFYNRRCCQFLLCQSWPNRYWLFLRHRQSLSAIS